MMFYLCFSGSITTGSRTGGFVGALPGQLSHLPSRRQKSPEDEEDDDEYEYEEEEEEEESR